MNPLILNIYGLFSRFFFEKELLVFFSLTFVYSPPSDTYGYQLVELIPNGAHTVSSVTEERY